MQTETLATGAQTKDAAPAKVICPCRQYKMARSLPVDLAESLGLDLLVEVMQSYKLMGSGPKPFRVNPLQAFTVWKGFSACFVSLRPFHATLLHSRLCLVTCLC